MMRTLLCCVSFSFFFMLLFNSTPATQTNNMSDDGRSAKRCENMTLDKAVKIYIYFVRVTVAIMTAVLVFFFGLSMERECKSSRLNFVGKMFSVISYMGYIFMSALVFIVQLELKFFLKYINMLHYWPAKAGMQIFLGVQTLNAKENLDTAGLSSGTQRVIADITGWILVSTGLSLFALCMCCLLYSMID